MRDLEMKLVAGNTYWFHGIGKWKDSNGQIFEIACIRYPTQPDGKDIYIKSDTGAESLYRSVSEGEILSFEIVRIEKEGC